MDPSKTTDEQKTTTTSEVSNITQPKDEPLTCFFDLETVLREHAKPDDEISIVTLINKQRQGKYDVEFIIAIDKRIPVSESQLDFLLKHNCEITDTLIKRRDELTKRENNLIYKCQFIDPSNHEN